jgi:hypothetical protein
MASAADKNDMAAGGWGGVASDRAWSFFVENFSANSMRLTGRVTVLSTSVPESDFVTMAQPMFCYLCQ